MKKYSKIRRLGHERNESITRNNDDFLVFLEKYDGANFRFTLTSEGRFLFGSKNIEYTDGNGLPDYQDIDGRFRDAVDHIRDKLSPEEVEKVLGKEYTFFLENMVEHSLEYNWDEAPQVIGFDIYNHRDETYLEREKVKEAFEKLQIPVARKVDEMKAGEFKPESYEIPESEHRDGKAEGVVVINTDQEEDNRSGFSTRAKMVTEEFAEKHKKKTGARQSKEAIHGHEKIVSKYCTDARIRKNIQKMRDEGRELSMEMMENQSTNKGLPIRVATDIIEEEAQEIVKSNQKMDWKQYRSLVSKRCVYILKQQIQRQDKD